MSRLRALIAARGRVDLGLTSAEMARHLGVAASSISACLKGRIKEGQINRSLGINVPFFILARIAS